MPDDLVSAYSLIAAGDRDRQNMFAFYNCQLFWITELTIADVYRRKPEWC